MTRACSAVAFGVAVFAWATFAWAGHPWSGRNSEMEKAAKKACAVGEYQKGVSILADLYIETNDPNFVYNQGRCYQQNGRFAEAVNRFREYLRTAQGLSGADRKETEKQLAECEDALAKNTPPPTPRPVVTPSPVPAPTVVTLEPSAVVAQPVPPATEGQPGKGLRVAGVVCGVGGLVALGIGVVLDLETQSLSKGTTYIQSDENERSRLETLGWVSYGVGAAALASGVILYLAGRANASNDRPATALLVPVWGAEGASIVLKGSF